MKRDQHAALTGSAHPRIEGPEKVSGRAQYACDIRLPGQLCVRVLRSPLPHARITHIDVARAAAVPGVRAVLCVENAPQIAWYEGTNLFNRVVRFHGDEVAAVAADTDEAAEDALRAIEVRFEALPFSATLDDGQRGDAVVEARGDVERGMADGDVVIDATYTTQTAVHNALEPHGCTAAWEGDTLTLYESTQGIYAVRRTVAEKLGLPERNVRVITQHMGGGFGAKQIAWKHSIIAALLARRTGCPVQLALDREGENLAAGNRNATRQRVRLAARRDGALTAIQLDAEVQIGAYSVGGEDSEVIGTYLTLYRCPNVRVQQVPVRTNTGPAVAFRAPGHAEANFALESAMDELARKLDIDPIELRLRNYATEDQRKNKPYTNAAALKRCYERVAQAMAWGRARRNDADAVVRHGLGFAAHDWAGGQGFGPATVSVELDRDGTARLHTGTQDIGTGTRTALAQLTAEALGIPVERVTVVLGDTRSELYAPTSAGSATLATLAPAVREAAEAARKSGRGTGKRRKNRSDRSIRTCGAQCVEVEVNTATGDIRVLRLAAAHDCGRIVNPLLVESQVMGGITQGLGYALSETCVVDSKLGIVLNPNLEEYKVPTAGDVPRILNAMESMPDWEANESGAKGIGEPPIIPTAAAVANAVFDAVGVRLRELPLRREKLLR